MQPPKSEASQGKFKLCMVGEIGIRSNIDSNIFLVKTLEKRPVLPLDPQQLILMATEKNTDLCNVVRLLVLSTEVTLLKIS